MNVVPIKRGTARRLGLDLPPPDLVVHLEFDVDRLNRALASLHGMKRTGEGR